MVSRVASPRQTGRRPPPRFWRRQAPRKAEPTRTASRQTPAADMRAEGTLGGVNQAGVEVGGVQGVQNGLEGLHLAGGVVGDGAQVGVSTGDGHVGQILVDGQQLLPFPGRKPPQPIPVSMRTWASAWTPQGPRPQR